MKYKNIYSVILVLITSIILSWAIPSLVKIATASSSSYPFVYYSSSLQQFVLRERNENNELIQYDISGNEYTREQFDSITPLFSYRQLTLTGKMPERILGMEINANILRSKSFTWRYNPKEKNSPDPKLFILYESMSGRVNLESPGDVFRLSSNIEFIDIIKHSVNEEKSTVFQHAFEKAKFNFPARKVWGDMNPKKPYEEGYFILDSQGKLYHMKMVNGKPFVKNTNVDKEIEIEYFSMLQVEDKSFYGFIVDKQGFLYTLNTDGYGLTQLDIPAIDFRQDQVMLMANLFYWMVYIITPEKTTYNVLKSNTLNQHDAPHTIEAKSNSREKIAKWIFPLSLTFGNRYTEYVNPIVTTNITWSVAISLLLAAVYIFTFGKKRKGTKYIADIACIALFGIPGLLAAILIK